MLYGRGWEIQEASMSGTRRRFFQDAAVLGAGLFSLRESLRAAEPEGEQAKHAAHATQAAPRVFQPTVTPDVSDLPHEMDGGVKVFKLVAEPVKKKIAPFKTIDVQQGERVRVIFENRLPESTSMHWHGLELPIEQDGVPYISQKPVAPGEKYVYEFTVHQEGTFFYHAHSAMQEMMGLVGFFVAHPQRDYKPRVD